MKHRVLSILAALALGLTACGGAESAAEPPPEDAAPAMAEAGSPPLPDAAEAPAPDFDAAYGAYPPDTVVMTVDGSPVEWEIYFGALSQRAKFFWLSYGMGDYSAALDEDGRSVGDWIREQTEVDLRSMAMFRRWAEELGLGLSEEDEAAVDAEIRDYAEAWYGGDTAAMFEDLGASEAFTRYQGSYARLNDLVFAHFFGEHGALLSDEDAVAYAEDNGYVHAKRILFRSIDDMGRQLPDKEKLARRSEAEEALAELRAGPPETLAQRFDAMMRARSQDQGLSAYPDGYYFREGEIDAMYAATLALEEGELSGVVDCDYGYQLILRLPMDPEEVFETEESSGEVYTLRSWAAAMLFNAMAEERYEASTVEYASGFEDLDVAALFAPKQ
ncbi:MAG: hypothetical protein IJ705_07100 [Oscillospiraceae bacterium]|nr:hypothetical protein [Oscillospiraceae bacterium]